MKSYYQHLETTKAIGENFPLTKKPVFRSSAIFPVLHNPDLTTRILFLGYWLLKRNISSIGFLYTLRDKQGGIISRKYFLVDSAKGFTIEIGSILGELNYSEDLRFEGSLELEIFSTVDLVFPYPAFVVHYYNEEFGTVVHTVGRIYNDIEDFKENEEYVVPEAGFDIYGGKNFQPFIAFTNGPLKNSNQRLTCHVWKQGKEMVVKDFEIGELQPYETVFLLLKKYINLDELLGEEAGTIKISHNFQGFFPRFLAGNFEKNQHAISVTHTYYDSSSVQDEKAYWNRADERFYDSTILIPFYSAGDLYTNVVLYPVFSPSEFSIFFHFFDKSGKKVLESDIYSITDTNQSFRLFKLKEVVLSKGVNLAEISSAKIICQWKDKTRVPTRLKLGLNVGYANRELKLPCNICFAPQLGNPNMLKKPGTFKWMPILNIHNSEVVITNSAPLIEYKKEANVSLKFYRDSDNEFIEETISIPPDGIHYISIKDNVKIKEFLNGEAGWLTAQSDNAFINAWYFDFSEKGSVAADHSF